MTFPIDFPTLNDFGKEFLGQSRLLRNPSRSAPFPTSVDWSRIMAIMRWDRVNPRADRINLRALATNTPFVAPLHSTPNRFTPGFQVMIDQQAAVVDRDPATSMLIAVDPLRINMVLFGL
jgi:hypothetical protein